MKREEQIERMQSAEPRTAGYLRTWMQDPAVKAAFHRRPRQIPVADERREEPRRRFG